MLRLPEIKEFTELSEYLCGSNEYIQNQSNTLNNQHGTCFPRQRNLQMLQMKAGHKKMYVY
jgi:hypothetical protein